MLCTPAVFTSPCIPLTHPVPWSWNTAVYLVYTAVYPRYTAVYPQYTAVYREYTAVYLHTHFEYTAVYSEVYGRILIVFVANFDLFCLVLC